MVKRKRKELKKIKHVKKQTRYKLLIPIAIAIIMIAVSVALWLSNLQRTERVEELMIECPKPSGYGSDQKLALIVDGLSLDFPNPDLISKLKTVLSEAGYVVDVYEGKNVTLRLYQCIPSMGYDLIVFRIHSAIFNPQLVPKEELFPAFFTNEEYSLERYLNEQFSGLVVPAVPITPGLYSTETTQYFAATPNIFAQASGNFKDTVVIVSSCFSAITDKAARVFLEKGASVYIGWNDLVSVEHMDIATFLLVKEIANGLDPFYATLKVNMTLGPDPNSGGYLRVFR